ncbi:ead/Ea22-like family protein [Escherichia coli]|uniref:ead/Ea22-like family protein n=3 Tax=Escherichia coli TaxID=562 RepID=UPI0023E38388|nr:ead/Ea22-like family protein [Escherichia coli]WES51370.1 ead/Ea22-like family protein [Escherichia coli]WES55911.1 ead/Ea22-like family protein [Escherichia coli]
MNKIDYQALREAAERATPAMERLLMLPVDDDLLSEQELKDYGVDIDALNAFKFLTGPETVLALLDERERNQQYIKRRDQENEDIALTVGKLRVELEAAEKRIAELESLTVPQLPQQAVPDEMPEPDTARMFFTDAVVAIAKVQGWNACRAAMLHSAEPVSQAYKLPVNTPCQDAPAHIWLQTAGVWPEDGELSELTWCSHNQHHDDTLYVRADLVNGNSPVTPDGWISCSDRMPEDTKMLLAFSQGEIVAAYWNWVVNPIDYKKYRAFTYLSGYILDDVTHWMPLPEPPL